VAAVRAGVAGSDLPGAARALHDLKSSAALLGAVELERVARELERLGGKGAYSIIGPSWASAAVAPLATYKFWAGEGGIRVPLVVSGVRGMIPNRIEPSFAHITDIVPTILELAGIALPGESYRGASIERMTGKSLVPVLQGRASYAHDADESIGYELSGNAALFKGDLKLVKNLPPIGDAEWHLYDIARDPGEVTDLRARMPELFAAMQADYDAYAKRVGVLPMPPGYAPAEQIALNSLFNVYIPALQAMAPKLLASVAAMILAVVILIRMRRSNH